MTPEEGHTEALRRIDKARQAGETKLNLSNLDLIGIPAELVYCTSLYSLDLQFNRISRLENLPDNLQWLYFSHNQIRRLENLPHNLKSLVISDNQINQLQNLPDSLQNLDLTRNRINKLENLPNSLESLVLTENRVSRLENLSSNLKWLIAPHNQVSRLENLPDNLKILTLQNNHIRWLEKLPDRLQTLKLFGNYTENVPPELLGESYDSDCLEAVNAWFADLAQGYEVNQIVRLLITGNSNVGKSSLVEALQNGRCTTSFDSTHAIRIETLSLNGSKPVSCQVFDFGGQEIYTGTHQLFLRGRAVQLIVFDAQSEASTDVPDRTTAEPTRNQPLPFWVYSVLQQSPDSQFVLAQNKMDVPLRVDALTENLLTQYEHACMAVAKVSATTGRNISALHGHLCEAAYSLPEYGMQMPTSWHQIRQYFIDNLYLHSEKRQRLLSLNDFYALCHECKVLAGAEMSLLTYLHRSGTVYYNATYLPHVLIADQEWAITAIYAVLDKKKELYERLRNQSFGKCQVRDLFAVWGDNYTPSQRWLLLTFMESCGLCFPLKQKGYSQSDENTYYIFPEFLPAETPEILEEFIQNTGRPKRIFRQTLDFLPYAHVQQLIARWGLKTPIGNISRTALYVRISKGRFALTADLKQHTLTLYAETSFSKDWLRNLLKQFAYQNTNWQEITTSSDTPPTVSRTEPTGSVDVLAKAPDVVQPKIRNIFFSYSHKDELYRNELETHLSMLKRKRRVEIWHDRKIVSGERWDPTIEAQLRQADIVLLMISADFLNSDYIWNNELDIVRERMQKQDGIKAIPIFTRPCDTTELDFMEIQGGQRDNQGKLPWISSSPDRDQIYLDIVREIRTTIESMK